MVILPLLYGAKAGWKCITVRASLLPSTPSSAYASHKMLKSHDLHQEMVQYNKECIFRLFQDRDILKSSPECSLCCLKS